MKSLIKWSSFSLTELLVIDKVYTSLLDDLCVCTGNPDPPSYVSLTVASSSSLLVKFDEPLNHNGAVVTRYKGRGNFFSWTVYSVVVTNNWKDYFIKRQNVVKVKSEVSRQQRHSLTFQCFLFLSFFKHIKMSYLFSPQVFNKHIGIRKRKLYYWCIFFFFNEFYKVIISKNIL